MNSHDYITKLQLQVDELAKEISNLRDRAKQLSFEARVTYDNQIGELQRRKEQLIRRMDMMRDMAVI